MERVLQNLIKNAYTHGKDSLRIRLSQNAIEIANKLSGPLDTAQIFDRFYTADASRSNKSTGLGLAIVQALVARMGGEVCARVEEELLVMTVVFPRG
jgi:signal transduction histidine kinase